MPSTTLRDRNASNALPTATPVVEPEDAYLMPSTTLRDRNASNALPTAGAHAAAAAAAAASNPANKAGAGSRSPGLGLTATPKPEPESPIVPPRSISLPASPSPALPASPGPALPARSPRLQRRPLPPTPLTTPSTQVDHGGQRRATALQPPSPRDERSPSIPARSRKLTQFVFERPVTPTTPAITEADDDGDADEYCTSRGNSRKEQNTS